MEGDWSYYYKYLLLGWKLEGEYPGFINVISIALLIPEMLGLWGIYFLIHHFKALKGKH
jgi:hypothetical protein